MEEQLQTEGLIASGYAFLNEEDAKRAANEEKRINQLEEKLDYSKPESILLIYRKAIQERVFKTPVGIQYLKKMQNYLLSREEIDKEKILPIPLYTSFESALRENTTPTRIRVKPAPAKKKQSQLLPISLVLNVALVCAVLAMFFIALNSKQPNLINYETALVNKYSQWEQELTQREQVVREKERELSIHKEF